MGCIVGRDQNTRDVRQLRDSRKIKSWGVFETIQYSSVQMRGWKKIMDNRVICFSFSNRKETYSIFAIFDGLGNPEISHYMKKNFAGKLLYSSDFVKKNFREAIISTFQQINTHLASKIGSEQIREIAEQLKISWQKKEGFLGSTAVLALFTKNQIFVSHVGNCKAVIIRGNNIFHETRNHDMINSKQVKRIYDDEEQETNPQIEDIEFPTRALGYFMEGKNFPKRKMKCTPQISFFQRNFSGFLMLGSSGVWEQMKISQIVKDITQITSKNQKQIPLKLCEISQKIMDRQVASRYTQHYGKNNMSIILLKFDSPMH